MKGNGILMGSYCPGQHAMKAAYAYTTKEGMAKREFRKGAREGK